MPNFKNVLHLLYPCTSKFGVGIKGFAQPLFPGSVLLTCRAVVGWWTRGLCSWFNWQVTGLVRNHSLDHHLGLERAWVDVGVGDCQLSRYQGSTLISKVPVEGDVRIAKVLAWVVEGDRKGNGLVLDKTQVSRHNVVDLVKWDGKGYLIWGGNRSMLARETVPCGNSCSKI